MRKSFIKHMVSITILIMTFMLIGCGNTQTTDDVLSTETTDSDLHCDEITLYYPDETTYVFNLYYNEKDIFRFDYTMENMRWERIDKDGWLEDTAYILSDTLYYRENLDDEFSIFSGTYHIKPIN